jgi:carboxyl-terminal processing protease
MKRLLLVLCLLLAACSTSAKPSPQPAATTSPNSAATTSPNITADAGVALVEQAVGLILDNYVDALQSGSLYEAAYRGAAATLSSTGATPQPAPTFTNDRQHDAATFRQAYLALATSAGPTVNQTDLAYDAIEAVTRQVDECHTFFMDPQAFRQFQASLQGDATYAGIGVTIRAATNPPIIGEVFPGSPAEAKGLKPGDEILAVDGTSVVGMPTDQIALLVRGPVGTQVTLTIQRPGEPAPRTVTMTRAQVQVPVFTSRVIPGADGRPIGYMKLYSFSVGADEQLQQALKSFQEQGVSGWVLDLRDNGGGYIDVLAKIGSRFIHDGQPIAYTVVRDGKEEPIGTDPSLYFTPEQPFAMLINGGSASSSEALAAAAKDYGFARLFGETTAGCLAAASTFPLADGSALSITIQKVISPKRREINQMGQSPDEVASPDPTSATDPALDAALRWLATQR